MALEWAETCRRVPVCAIIYSKVSDVLDGKFYSAQISYLLSS
jgi:hypothetical protein